ncbi:hypothetical protein D3C75_1312280 [compost metagenome]
MLSPLKARIGTGHITGTADRSVIDNGSIYYGGQMALCASRITISSLAESPGRIFQAAGLGFFGQVLNRSLVAYY